jgi:broad specificity phosphatase PhoE
MFGIYLTHPQIRIEPDVPVPRWGLSEIGIARAEKAAQRGWAQQLSRILSSDETKALETAAILSRSNGLDVEVLEHSGENDRSATGFLVPEEFEKAANWFFANPEQSFHGWEKAVDAQKRIVSAVSSVLDRHDPAKPIAFVGHGGVGTLLKCYLGGLPISRSQDQLAGGGCVYAFSLADRSLACDWTAMELWQGWQK